MHVGKAIRAIRLAKNLCQEAVAAATGISGTALSNIETEKTTEVTVPRLEKIAVALGTTVEVIIHLAENIS
ncbi:helix-turn-helix domain-containing protein [Parafilimonas sp.]|uniref:helix-turn-helix domain-containing protein n=1 Tax=Parafilimonas sp. TaxID=1969739 RepID=UPI0039E40DBC